MNELAQDKQHQADMLTCVFVNFVPKYIKLVNGRQILKAYTVEPLNRGRCGDNNNQTIISN